MKKETKIIAGIEVNIGTNGYGEQSARIENFNGSSFTIEKSPMGDLYLKRNFSEPIDKHGTTSACVVLKCRRSGKVTDSILDYHITGDAKMDEESQSKLIDFMENLTLMG